DRRSGAASDPLVWHNRHPFCTGSRCGAALVRVGEDACQIAKQGPSNGSTKPKALVSSVAKVVRTCSCTSAPSVALASKPCKKVRRSASKSSKDKRACRPKKSRLPEVPDLGLFRQTATCLLR